MAITPVPPVLDNSMEQINLAIRSLNDRLTQLAGDISPNPKQGASAVVLAGGQNNDVVIGQGILVELLCPQAATVTGMAGGIANQLCILKNPGTTTLTLSHESVGSQAANRFKTRTASDMSLATGAAILVAYDGVRQRWVNAVP